MPIKLDKFTQYCNFLPLPMLSMVWETAAIVGISSALGLVLMIRNWSNRLALVAAVSLCVMPTAASATTVSASSPTVTGYSPMVALSILGSSVSAAALCGAATLSAAQSPTGGCVLPALDAPPPVAIVAPPPPPPPIYAPVAVASSNSFLVPLIGGLAALVGVLALIALSDHNPRGGKRPPPISPQ